MMNSGTDRQPVDPRGDAALLAALTKSPVDGMQMTRSAFGGGSLCSLVLTPR